MLGPLEVPDVKIFLEKVFLSSQTSNELPLLEKFLDLLKLSIIFFTFSRIWISRFPTIIKLGTVKKVRNISKIQNIFNYLKNHLISAAITILSPKIINFCFIRKYRQKGILIHFFYFFLLLLRFYRLF